MKLSEMKQTLASDGIQLTKSLGQNFLHDANQLRRIVAVAELTREDKVLEIGPGLGPLTELLIQSAGQVLAIEKDQRLVIALTRRFEAELVHGFPGEHTLAWPLESGRTGSEPKRCVLNLVHDDALDFLRRAPRDWSRWKLVANLPYSVASPILVELAHSANGPQRMVATLQLEVARRLVAKAGEPDYGVLTLLLGLDYEATGSFKIPASCFFPEPEVDSACVCLARRAQPFLAPEQRIDFVRIVKRSFSQRRKTMLKLLKADWPAEKLEAAFAIVNLPPLSRAESISVLQFVLLTKCLKNTTHV
jgi:16S rRNA (adenine1518-N6/adenine1519-N6)-dimethyltransferase